MCPPNVFFHGRLFNFHLGFRSKAFHNPRPPMCGRHISLEATRRGSREIYGGPLSKQERWVEISWRKGFKNQPTLSFAVSSPKNGPMFFLNSYHKFQTLDSPQKIPKHVWLQTFVWVHIGHNTSIPGSARRLPNVELCTWSKPRSAPGCSSKQHGKLRIAWILANVSTTYGSDVPT